MADNPSETIDAFHRGAFHIVQPKGRGHRSGMDAMLLAALVADERPIRVADLGAGAGAAGMAVASRLDRADVVLFERSPDMADFARKSLLLSENARFADRVSVIEADVTLTGKNRNEAGLPDDSFHHVIMNPPFNDASDRLTPDALKAEAHAMTDGLFERWIRTAGAIMIPGGLLFSADLHYHRKAKLNRALVKVCSHPPVWLTPSRPQRIIHSGRRIAPADRSTIRPDGASASIALSGEKVTA